MQRTIEHIGLSSGKITLRVSSPDKKVSLKIEGQKPIASEIANGRAEFKFDFKKLDPNSEHQIKVASPGIGFLAKKYSLSPGSIDESRAKSKKHNHLWIVTVGVNGFPTLVNREQAKVIEVASSKMESTITISDDKLLVLRNRDSKIEIYCATTNGVLTIDQILLNRISDLSEYGDTAWDIYCEGIRLRYHDESIGNPRDVHHKYHDVVSTNQNNMIRVRPYWTANGYLSLMASK